jgi:hypothetical protein
MDTAGSRDGRSVRVGCARAATAPGRGARGTITGRPAATGTLAPSRRSADDVFITIPASISINQDAFAGTLTLASGVTLTGNQLLAVSGALTLSASSGAVTMIRTSAPWGSNKSGAGSLSFASAAR